MHFSLTTALSTLTLLLLSTPSLAKLACCAVTPSGYITGDKGTRGCCTGQGHNVINDPQGEQIVSQKVPKGSNQTKPAAHPPPPNHLVSLVYR